MVLYCFIAACIIKRFKTGIGTSLSKIVCSDNVKGFYCTGSRLGEELKAPNKNCPDCWIANASRHTARAPACSESLKQMPAYPQEGGITREDASRAESCPLPYFSLRR